MTWMKERFRQFIRIQPMPPHDLYDLVYIFFAGGFLGTFYEVLQYLLIHGLLEDRRGSILLPINYVYALGALSIFFVMYHFKKPLPIFAWGTVLGGVVEYGLSVLQEYVLGSRSWDYSARPLNINGRTTIPYMLVWGILCYLAMRFVFPPLLKLIHKIPTKIRKRLAVAVFALIIVDLIITLLAVIRYSQRGDGIYFDNALMNLVDNIFNDGFMQRHFPNMILN
ncbi:MAG: putative ABC transporter permease [Fusicatenibacter sp.]